MRPLVDVLAPLIAQHCNADRDSLPMIRQRLYDTLKRGTYRVRFDEQERLIGYCDYDCSYDGIVHVRKMIALRPHILRSLVRELKTTVPWTRMYLYRAKYQQWRHHAKPRSVRHAVV